MFKDTVLPETDVFIAPPFTLAEFVMLSALNVGVALVATLCPIAIVAFEPSPGVWVIVTPVP